MMKLNRIFFAVLGMLMITFGIAFIVVMSERFGAGSFEALCIAIESFIKNSLSLPFTPSLGSIITGASLVVILIAYLIAKTYKKIPIVSIVLAFGFGMLTDFWINIVGIGKLKEVNLNDFVFILIMLVNITIVTLGACLMIIANLGLTPLDYLVDTIAKKFRLSFGTAKILFEAIVVALGIGVSYLVGVTSHIGLITFTLGIIIGIELKIMLPWVKKFFTNRKII